jgi:DNA-binding MarR family transcriptional regulator
MSSFPSKLGPVATEWLTGDEQATWQNYRRMSRLVEAEISKGLLQASLSIQDYDVLSSLSAHDGGICSPKQLGSHLRWSPSRLSHHIDRMERRRLVERQTRRGRRSFEVLITAAGRSAIASAAPAHVSLVRQLFMDHLSSEQLQTLNDVSARVIARINAAERQR